MRSVVKRRRAVALLASAVALSAAGLVFAAWLASGGGSGYAQAGTAQALSTVSVSAATGDALYPGGTGDVVIKISNPNPYPVSITSVSLDGAASAITADAGHAACTTTGVSFTDQTGLSIAVPANGDATATLTDAVAMSNASLNGCQGATFTIPVTFTGASAA